MHSQNKACEEDQRWMIWKRKRLGWKKVFFYKLDLMITDLKEFN